METGVAGSNVHVEVRQGSARDEIVNAAAEWMADKILVGAHGRSPNRLFPTTIARSVVRHAPCSVELVRLPKLTEEEATAASKNQTGIPVGSSSSASLTHCSLVTCSRKPCQDVANTAWIRHLCQESIALLTERIRIHALLMDSLRVYDPA